MDTTFRQLIAAGDLDQLAAFFTEHGDYGESYELLIDAAVIGHDSVELVNLLLSNGAELAPNVLEAALATQSILEVLLASGVDVNSTNEQNETALHSLLKQTQPSVATVLLLTRHGAILDSKCQTLIRQLVAAPEQLTVQEGIELEALLDSPDQRPKHTRVENWLNQSQQDDLDEKESSIDSFQSLNEDIRTLRDENHKLRDQLIQREGELQRKNERIKELERQQKQHQQHNNIGKSSKKTKSAFISMKI